MFAASRCYSPPFSLHPNRYKNIIIFGSEINNAYNNVFYFFSLFQAKLETKALKAKRPGFTDERYHETSYYIENGKCFFFFRRVFFMRVGGILTIILFIQFVNGVYGGGG